jgi:hypothetical protein
MGLASAIQDLCSLLRDYAIIGLQGKVVSIQSHNAQFVKIKSNNEF